MFHQLGITFRSYRLYDYATKSVGKSDSLKRYGYLENETHRLMNKVGEVYGVIATPEQINQLLSEDKGEGWQII